MVSHGLTRYKLVEHVLRGLTGAGISLNQASDNPKICIFGVHKIEFWNAQCLQIVECPPEERLDSGLRPHRHKVVGVQAFDMGSSLLEPVGQFFQGHLRHSGWIVERSTDGFIADDPGHYCRVVLVFPQIDRVGSVHQGSNPVPEMLTKG